jgi:hypothetical protein
VGSAAANQEAALPQKVILLECSAPHWIKVLERLQRFEIIPVYWTAWKHLRNAVEGAFPACPFHDTLHAKRALEKDGSDPADAPFDAACESVWREDAQIVFDMMNRFDHSRDLTFVERSTIFYRLLGFWRAKLAQLAPDLVVFCAPPHVVYDYVVLALCRRLGIRTIMFEEATIYPPYSLVMSDYRDGAPELARTFAELVAAPDCTISETSRQIINKLRGSYRDAKPFREVEAHAQMEASRRAGLTGLLERVAVISALDAENDGSYRTNEKLVNVSSLYKERGKSLRDSFEGPYANTRYINQVLAERIETELLRNFYHKHTTAPEAITGSFVYMPLAGQPERTSNPQADMFCNQLLMANTVASSLPKGWSLVIKEHPNQFHPEFAVNMCRSTEYYRTLLAISHVHFVATDVDPFWLVDRASIIATTGGTTALEAAARGKPSLLFGDAWYRDCPGVVRVRNLADTRSFFERYQEGFDIAPEAFERFIEAISRACFRGLADFPPAGYDMDETENIENLASLIRTRLTKSGQSNTPVWGQPSRLLPDLFEALKRHRSARARTA